ncbi:hypothetical protein B4123_1397 [Bacillus paralicheniformis]|nr:hypothetical protein B4123_1980 [Bacillus paralicheniformis]OLG12163.1 hypothetical protein B4123_1397 [Bacillus paralicheniformis]TWJ57117.1 hypothetical protein CHCC5023_1393 [Bacillus paralicheniformis]TWJ69890.1 hypothetical protein CHCC5019_2415 [Bacillus paralicheniformis]TWN94277.1 hypothetical protein CHCC20490_1676 [Bacillus paralicheniformis]
MCWKAFFGTLIQMKNKKLAEKQEFLCKLYKMLFFTDIQKQALPKIRYR